MLRSVLFPQPLGPINETTSPSLIPSETPSTAVTKRSVALIALRLAKRLVTFWNSRRSTSCLLARLLERVATHLAHRSLERLRGPRLAVERRNADVIQARYDLGQLVDLACKHIL